MLRRGVTWRAKKTVLHLWASSYEMCDITHVDDECLCLDAGTNDELLEKLPRALDIMQGVLHSSFPGTQLGSHLKQNVCCTWLVAERSTRGEQLRDLLSNVQRQDLVLRNMCVARLVGSSATLCRVTNMSDHWSMVLVVWNVSYKRALLLQTECISRLPRKS